MFRNIAWLAFINIKNKKIRSLLLFLLTFFIALSLFLVNISKTMLKLPDYRDIGQFFYVIIFSMLFLSIFLLATVSILFILMRRNEIGILRMFGARKADVLLLLTFEMLYICFTGSLVAILFLLILIFTRTIYLPYFLEGMNDLRTLKLTAIGGQTLFGVTFMEMLITVVLLSTFLKNDISELLRG